MLEQVEWGEFKLWDLFESSNGDFDIQKTHINWLWEYVITAWLTDNWILWKTDIPARIFDEWTITVDMFWYAFYRQFKYKIVTHARVFSLKPKFLMPERVWLFFASTFHFLNKEFGYENMCSWAKIENKKIKLPIKYWKIDFEFINKFIAELEAEHQAELEAEHQAELEAYLETTWLKNYELTNDELKILTDFKEWNIEWQKFKIWWEKWLFTVNSYKKRFDANKVTVLDYWMPYVVRTANNNWLRGYLDEDEKFLNEWNTISFGQDTATMFYQEMPYFTWDKIKIIKSKDNRFNKSNAHFFITSMAKAFSLFARWQSSFNVKIIENQDILLPIKDNHPDYELMSIFISAVKKLIIKDVVLYADKEIQATREVINSKSSN